MAAENTPVMGTVANAVIVPMKLRTARNQEPLDAAVRDMVGKLEKSSWDGQYHKAPSGVLAINLNVTVHRGGHEKEEVAEYELWARNVSDPGIEYFMVPADWRTNPKVEGYRTIGSHGREYGIKDMKLDIFTIGRRQAAAEAKAATPAPAPKAKAQAPKVEKAKPAAKPDGSGGHGKITKAEAIANRKAAEEAAKAKELDLAAPEEAAPGEPAKAEVVEEAPSEPTQPAEVAEAQES